MADKKSFLFYLDWHQQLEKLPAEQVGKLVLALCDFAENGNITEFNDGAMDMCFSFMTAQLQRDNEKYIETCRKRSEAGKKGARQKKANANKGKQTKQKKANANTCVQKVTNQADTDTDTDTETDTDLFIDVPPEIKPALSEYQDWRRSEGKEYKSRNGVRRAVNRLQEIAPDDYEEQTAVIYQALDGRYTEFVPLVGKSRKKTGRLSPADEFAEGGC